MTGAPQPGGRLNVALHGSGIAATAVAHLLRAQGVAVARGGTGPAASAAPVVMLGEAAVSLLSDVFAPADVIAPLLARAHRIDRRVVRWGGEDATAVPHRALAIAGADLHGALPAEGGTGSVAADGEPFALHAAAPYREPAILACGTRPAVAAPVRLAALADERAALVEAVDDGWLFLIPQGAGQGWLLAVGGAPQVLLPRSRLVAAAVASLAPATARFETAPRMLRTPAGPGFIALGQGAMAFDPICGDGTATAVRAALLAAAAVGAINKGFDPAAVLAHYRAMMIAALRRHLQVSLPFYRTGGASPWWQDQAEALAEGHAWCTRQLAQAGDPRFVLRGTALEPRDIAA